jgi:two-component system, cell cycle response regulator
MPSSHSVCLLGFSDFERRALALQFRLASGGGTPYDIVATPEDARFLLVDADAKAAVQRALASGRVADSLFVGSGAAPAEALGCLRRPIDALTLRRQLDAALRGATADTTAAPASSKPAPTVASSPAPRLVAVSAATPPAHLSQPAATAPDTHWPALADHFPDRVADAEAASGRPVKATPCDALLVDDSEIALKFLEIKLGELGLRSRSVTDSDAALAQLEQHDFNYVFLDVELGPASRLDGLALCRQIKRRSARPPVIAMISAHATQTDRVRGSLAGCDAYLGKPLQPSELMAVVGRRRGR